MKNVGILALQLDWPWIAVWANAGIFAVAVRFQNQDQFWVSHKKNQGSFFFSEKSKNELVQPKKKKFAILAKIRLFSNNSNTIVNPRLTSVQPFSSYV